MTVIDESGETAAIIVPPSFDHVGLSVGDLDAQRRFYTTAFGFAETHQADFAEAGARVSLLQTPNGAALELTERATSTPRPSLSAFDAAKKQGYFHWALAVSDLDAALTIARTHGANVISDPAQAHTTGAQFAYIADPEGNLIELVQLQRD